jgi:hypothetical protein
MRGEKHKRSGIRPLHSTILWFRAPRMTDAIGAERSNQVADQAVCRSDKYEKDQGESMCESRWS